MSQGTRVQRLAPGNAHLSEHGSQQECEKLKSVLHMHTHGMAHPARGSASVLSAQTRLWGNYHDRGCYIIRISPLHPSCSQRALP